MEWGGRPFLAHVHGKKRNPFGRFSDATQIIFCVRLMTEIYDDDFLIQTTQEKAVRPKDD